MSAAANEICSLTARRKQGQSRGAHGKKRATSCAADEPRVNQPHPGVPERPTPETDAAELIYDGQLSSGYADVDVCRKIERERDQWRGCAERLALALRETCDYRPLQTDRQQEALAEFDQLKGQPK